MKQFDVVIVGSGPAGLGVAFKLAESTQLKILILDKEKICSGGLLNDCKQNYTYPIGFTEEYWNKIDADRYLAEVEAHLKPNILPKENLEVYEKRAEKVGAKLINIRQSHVGTDKSKDLIRGLISQLQSMGVTVELGAEVLMQTTVGKEISYIKDCIGYQVSAKYLIYAPGRKGFSFLQDTMKNLEINYVDNILDVGIRVETKIENYPIVKDYYDPKFIFPNKVRTFCTNSGYATVVKEKYKDFFLVNGHAMSKDRGENGLVNFALLKTIGLKEPVRSGQQMAGYLARLANEIGGGKPIMQRIGDFRMNKRSYTETFNQDLYDFKPTCPVTAGDLGLVIPSRIMRDLWNSLKMLDTIIPGILHPSTILYYPEIKFYGNRPTFRDNHFKVKDNIYMIGDGAGTSRGITGAWASGIRAAEGIIKDCESNIGNNF